MILSFDSYQDYLKAELAKRIASNHAYSLRAFAQRLDISAPFLSQVLNRKKTFSADAALRVAMRLELNDSDSRYFCLLAQLESEKNPVYREEIARKLRSLNPKRKTMDLSLDAFHAISDWYHFPILELTCLAGFELTPHSAARKVGITTIQAEVAIDRLRRLELLELDSKGRLRKTRDYVLAQSHVHVPALKNFHQQMLAKAGAALLDQEPQERVSSTDVVAINPKYVNEVRALSDKYTEALLKISEKPGDKTEVYCLSVQFFSLTKQKEVKGRKQ